MKNNNLFLFITKLFWRNLQMYSKMFFLFAIFYISSRYLNPLEFGELNYLLALMVLFAFFSDFGLSAAVSKFTLDSVARFEDTKDLFITTVVINLIISAIASVGVVIFFIFTHLNWIYIPFIIGYIFLYSLSSVIDGYYRAKSKFKMMGIFFLILSAVFTVLCFFFITKYKILGVLTVSLLYYFFASLVLSIFCGFEKGKFSKKIGKDIFKYSLIVGMTSIFYFLFTKVDIFFLKHFNHVVEIGYYEIVNKVYSLILVIFTSMGLVIATKTATIATDGTKKKLRTNFLKHNLLIFILGIMISCILYYIFPIFIRLVFPKYESLEIHQMFNLLLLILPLRMMAEVIDQGYIVPTGNAKIIMNFMFIGALANLFLDYYFISCFGFIGVVYATIVSFLISFSGYTLRYLFIIR